MYDIFTLVVDPITFPLYFVLGLNVKLDGERIAYGRHIFRAKYKKVMFEWKNPSKVVIRFKTKGEIVF